MSEQDAITFLEKLAADQQNGFSVSPHDLEAAASGAHEGGTYDLFAMLLAAQ